MNKIKDKLVRLIRSVIRILKLALRVMIGLLHAFSVKCGDPKCRCENEREEYPDHSDDSENKE